MAKRREQAKVNREAMVVAERSARRALSAGLEAYGISSTTVEDPGVLLSTLNSRILAGRIARRAAELATLQSREAEAAAQVESILARLGFTQGDLAGRLERAIQAVEVARERQAVDQGQRNRTEVEAEIARLTILVDRNRRSGWEDGEDMTSAPADPDVLEARRRELAELIRAGATPDVVGADHRYRVGLAKVRDLETRLGEVNGDGSTIEARLRSRLNRTSLIGGSEETVPLLIDDAFFSLDNEEKMRVYDTLIDISAQTQIVVLTEDPVAASWARSRSGQEPVSLFEVADRDSSSHQVPVG